MTDLDLLDEVEREAEESTRSALEAEAALEAEMEPLLIREHLAWTTDDLP